MVRATDVIAAKRDGRELGEQEIGDFVRGYVAGDVADYQMSAWCMAVFLNGMSARETAFLTRAMIGSGGLLDVSGVRGPFVDKHSTGGVGDKVSLVLAPLAAACGLRVPMMSGRALGHTGGTLDKLDSIPGYGTELSGGRFREVLGRVGYAMTGQSAEVVPADRKMYALRDVTATVESVPLITASILSKKFAEGAEALVMDVKCGRGAFMKTLEEARCLARSLVSIGGELERPVAAVLTDMSEPLGVKVGNFLEVEEAVDCLRGRGPGDVMRLTLRLCAWMMRLGGVAEDLDVAEGVCRRAIEDGSALRLFWENVEAQGGRLGELEAMLGSARARFSCEVRAGRGGVMGLVDGLAVGMAAVDLGVGRRVASDDVEALAGIEVMKRGGESVSCGDVVFRLWAEDEGAMEMAFRRLEDAFVITGDGFLPGSGGG